MHNSATEEVQQPTFSNYTLSVIGAIITFLLFVLILVIAYLPLRPAPVNTEVNQIRTDKYNKVSADQKALVQGYAWVNQQEGSVRIPIDVAMKLTVERLQEAGSE